MVKTINNNLFTNLGLSKQIETEVNKSGFLKATAIQEKVIPLVLQKQDILAQAQTGSGKSASFILPILQMLSQTKTNSKAKIKALVLTPTRELTLQVADGFKTFGSGLEKKLKVVTLIGGEGIGSQIYEIQQGCDVLVATSGRFLDVVSKKQMNLSSVEFFVLDEADKMLNLGFSEELELILSEIPQKRQNLLFSATYPQKILDIASKITKEPIRVSIKESTPTVENIVQRAIEVDVENRAPLLREILKSERYKSVLVFMANKRATDNIASKFRKHGFSAESFHGELTQDDRNFTLDEFKAKKINILFATDIVSRGLDIDDIECVVNYDLPRSPTDYIHRIGRTARAGKSGIAISFITHENKEHFKIIQKKCKIDVSLEEIKGFEPKVKTSLKVKGQAPIKGKKKSKKDKLREQALKDAKEGN